MENMEQVSVANEPNFVAFRAADQDFCIDIMSVREIRGWTPATALPKAPAYIRGVINLRGSVVPILDFAMRLGLATPEPTSRHVVIIVQISHQTVGLLVDEVTEILGIAPEIDPPFPNCKDGPIQWGRINGRLWACRFQPFSGAPFVINW